MWSDITVFSIGDLCGEPNDMYFEFIEKRHNGNLQSRIEEIDDIIKRLNFERKKINQLLKNSD